MADSSEILLMVHFNMAKLVKNPSGSRAKGNELQITTTS